MMGISNSMTKATTECSPSTRRCATRCPSRTSLPVAGCPIGGPVGFRVIWFVARGAFRITQSGGAFEIAEGEAGILDSDAPFHCKVQHDESGCFESYQMIVPAYLFMEHLQGADLISKSFELMTPDGKVVQRLLHLLVNDGENLSRKVAKPLVDSLLEAVATCISKGEEGTPKQQTHVDKRLSGIEDYILMNLTDPDLCYSRVAANCGISPRYLCYLLKANNTSFSELLWSNRLAKAKGLLLALAAQDFPIQEIAFMSGFKSAAHFSRMFKAANGCPPKEFRSANTASEPEALEQSVGQMLSPSSIDGNQLGSSSQVLTWPGSQNAVRPRKPEVSAKPIWA
jgi:AraC-like DNA-binding protein